MAIVPVKPLAEAKSRLSTVLCHSDRMALARRLLERTLLKLVRARGLAGIAVVSRDETVLKIARKYGAFGILETNTGLNGALDQARRVCIANGARAVLILPADLPRVRVRDIEKIMALGEQAPRIVIAPAERDGGTNALLLHPAHAIEFQFGDHSFQKHAESAATNQIPVALYESDTVTFDLDVPEDLKRHTR